MNIGRPALKRLLQERDRPVRLFLRLRAPGVPREEGVVLVAALADVGDHEVLVRPDVDFISDLAVVRAVVSEFPSKHRVARIRDTGAISPSGLVPHRRPDLRPDAVGTYQDIS